MPITSIPLITHKNYTNKAMPSILALIIFKPLSTTQLPVRPPSSLAPCVGCSVLLGTPRLKSPTSGVNPNPWFPALLPHSAETTAHMCDKRASVPPSLLFHCSQLTSDLAAYTSWLNSQPTRVSLKCIIAHFLIRLGEHCGISPTQRFSCWALLSLGECTCAPK